MFKNAGGKLKGLAILNFWIFLIGGIIIGFTIFKTAVISFICIAISLLLGWVSSIVLYAFGELCNNVQTIADTVNSYNPNDHRTEQEKDFDDYLDALKKI